jgi:hypothetical protein
MKNNQLTKTQREIYNAVKTDGWFKSDDHSIFAHFRNRDSQCRKMVEKGYLEMKAVFPKGIQNTWCSYSLFRKIKNPEAPHG